MIRIALCIVLIASLMGHQELSSQTVIIRSDNFTSRYNLQLLCPDLVEWKLYKSDIGKVVREKNWRFRNDIPLRDAIARHEDYTNSGYDRGHLCPSHDRSAATARMKKTFVMSNIAPQLPFVNRVSWYETERICRADALAFDSIGIVAIPVFLDRDTVFIGKHRLAVPHGFVKVAWKMDNDSILHTWYIWNK